MLQVYASGCWQILVIILSTLNRIERILGDKIIVSIPPQYRPLQSNLADVMNYHYVLDFGFIIKTFLRTSRAIDMKTNGNNRILLK